MENPTRLALITGASRGIGRTIAEHLAARGIAVVLFARREDDLRETAEAIADAGGHAIVHPADVTDASAVEQIVDQTERNVGPIDLAVSNAGRLEAIGPTWRQDPANFRQDMTVNVLGVFHVCRALVPRMIDRAGGRIVNTVGGGTAKPFHFGNAYGTSKAAVQRLTETLDRELAEQAPAVRAFALNPGLVETEMTQRFRDDPAKRRWLGRLGQRLETGDHYPPEAAAEVVAAIAEGRLDALRGRFLNAELGGDALERAAGGAVGDDRWTLRIVD